ncbi:polypeptide N-acetylgalactosaminyltransferase 15 isoform X1 [Tachyglossus aculeatus]|uniref:polypeptide N-acetylgalactosaminyltransferase 15 isoform X1 n=2 Tax=Tachyglossus aculeatus TaxID=9261 RepID=UPI0018F74C41|nr:polypeptide N-acetylgalactosaminyltransferase 15 isoform X1 [Tachyglossus aculeatus]
MPLKKRCRYGSRQLQFLLLFLMLGCFLMMAVMLNPPSQDPQRARISRPEHLLPEDRYQLDFGESQEWVLETQEESQQYYPLEGLAPFLSLREDELLVANPTARRNQSRGRRGRGYRLVKKQGRRPEEFAEGRPGAGWRGMFVAFPRPDGRGPGGDELLGETHGFNEALSERISLHRELPEVRHPLCLQQRYGDNLPSASVIICFHNEAWSTLLRTVHSILDTVPRPHLKEIILVDDLSQQDHLRSALSDYVSKLDGVKLLRSNKRLGVIRGRMLGAARAAGDVLVFMDSHCECHRGWLEPLLSRIASNRNRVVTPVLDVIDWKTFQYFHSEDLQQGVFDWKLDFHWALLPEQERKVRQSPISPIRSPVVPGGVVAMDRHYFQNTGAYDSLMSLWGGENLELSIRVWLCGGSVEILPCSRVGHVYRNQASTTLPIQEAVLRNKIRIAETWLGSFKEIFYQHSPEAFSLRKVEKPDCSERLQLQRRLGCRTFHWFLANIYPELYPSEHRPGFSGKLFSTRVGFCVDGGSKGNIPGSSIMLLPCSDSQHQHLEYTSRKEIRSGTKLQLCFDVREEQLILQNCLEEAHTIHQQLWDVQENGWIVHILSGKCIEAGQSEQEDLYLRLCDQKADQLWRFEHVNKVDVR